MRGPYLLAHYMMEVFGDETRGTFIVGASNAAALVFLGISAYSCSKLAVTRLLEKFQHGEQNKSGGCCGRWY